MLHSQRQFLPFLYLRRSNENRFTFSGQKIEKVVTKTGTL